MFKWRTRFICYLVLALVCSFGLAKTVKAADEKYTWSKYDLKKILGDLDNIGRGGGLFAGDRRIVKGAPNDVKLQFDEDASFLVIRNDTHSLHEPTGLSYAIASNSKIYILRPDDRKGAKPFLYVKRGADFREVSYNEFKPISSESESRVYSDDRVHTWPISSKYGLASTVNGEGKFITGTAGNGSFQYSSVRGPMPRSSWWNFGDSTIMWGNFEDGWSISNRYYVPTTIDAAINVGYVKKDSKGNLVEMSESDMIAADDVYKERNAIMETGIYYSATKEETEKYYQDLKKNADKKKEKDEQHGFWYNLFKPLWDFLKKFWEIFVYNDKEIKRTIELFKATFMSRFSKNGVVTYHGSSSNAYNRSGNFIFDNLFNLGDSAAGPGRVSTLYGTTLNTYYVNKSSWADLLKSICRFIYTLAFTGYIWRKKEKIVS